ncbi:membrane bound O-acyl transferase family-domain-containing protein [Echria macrotheca]|uniref:Membrane bound O-acyl transferase family-domain-containing protein n=1 Tax=Echria macrotheca TaxID=438768 RepID=A0AAJ0B803_9PEZI|nr:membrane bound O-acyl transferase family-domain-containing protein [Echria macrotheca]
MSPNWHPALSHAWAWDTNLPARYLGLYRAEFYSEVLSLGTARYFVIPYTLFGCLLPVLYLSVPHRDRLWLRSARFVVALGVVLLNWEIIRSGTSSASIAVSYATGLVAAWGTVWGVGLVLCVDVQRGVARVRVRERRGGGWAGEGGADRLTGGEEEEKKQAAVADEGELPPREYEHYWETYPEDGGFFKRLAWVWDLFSSFRGIGWNIAIPSVPHPRPGVDLSAAISSMPLKSPTGFHRSTTYRAFLANRLFHLAWSYIVLDLWTITARFDPYFVPGPSPAPSHALPPALAPLPASVLSLLRSAAAAAGVLAALFSYFNFPQLVAASLPGYNPLWQHPSIFGSFSANILDRGLAGLWGGWWHQSFRLGFTLPTRFLVRKGVLLEKGTLTKLVGMFIAFLLSGIMHAAGGYTSIPETTVIYTPVLFFMLQFVGICLQSGLGWAVFRMIGDVPRGWKRAGNLVFVVAWMHWTNGLFIGDLSRSAIWLFEPVPFSVLRAVGLGPKGDSAWRWDREYMPRWHWGTHWWETGVRI